MGPGGRPATRESRFCLSQLLEAQGASLSAAVVPVDAVEADDLVVGKNEFDGDGLPASPGAMLSDLPETAFLADSENSCGYLPRITIGRQCQRLGQPAADVGQGHA
jgi:hypothetical protein